MSFLKNIQLFSDIHIKGKILTFKLLLFITIYSYIISEERQRFVLKNCDLMTYILLKCHFIGLRKQYQTSEKKEQINTSKIKVIIIIIP